MSAYPKLRDGLEALPVLHQNRRMLLLRDRLGFSPDSLIIDPRLAGLLALMTGENSLRDMQLHYLRTTGELLYMEHLQEFVQKLDENFFLENERFFHVMAEEARAFSENPVRPMCHAGRSYPSDPQDLKVQLEQFFSQVSYPAASRESNPRQLIGLVAPHIDISAGGPSFAYAYRAVMEAEAPSTWIVLGTGHEPVQNYFALTVKDFETPLGIVPCNRLLSEKLIKEMPRNLLASEYNHRREHVIEFQAVFLAHVQPGCSIVPILCSFSVEEWETERRYIDGFAAVLGDLCANEKEKIGLLASVDLAHIGPRYGDTFQPDTQTVHQHLRADRELLECLEQCDSQNFMRIIGSTRNRRRICGMAPLYILAAALGSHARGFTLDHRYAVVDQYHSFVTFASMAFYRS